MPQILYKELINVHNWVLPSSLISCRGPICSDVIDEKSILFSYVSADKFAI